MHNSIYRLYYAHVAIGLRKYYIKYIAMFVKFVPALNNFIIMGNITTDIY